MAGSAQKPPAARPSWLERAGRAATEVLALGVGLFVGSLAVAILMLVGVVPQSGAAALPTGAFVIGSAGLIYLGLERVWLSRDGTPPLVAKAERAGLLRGLLIAAGAIVTATAGSAAIAVLQDQLFELEVEEQQVIVELIARGDRLELAVLALSAVVLAPLAEELLFRRMFFHRLYVRVGPTAAWILPALAFAAAHWNPVGLAVYAWLGLVFAMAYLLSGRLWVAVLAHAGHNALTLALLLSETPPGS